MTALKVLAAAVATLGAVAALAGGQTVRGVVVDSAGAALPGVVVLMLDAASNPAARALTNDRGEYRVATPRPGTFRLHTLRIGFRPVTSEPIELLSGQEVTHRLVLGGIPLSLAAVHVEGRSDCRAVGDAAATFAVWEQARAALTATQLTAGARAISASTVTYDRIMDAAFRRVLAETASVHTELVTQPWRSLPPQTVRQVGYVTEDRDGTTTYSAPGLDVLLSNTFLEDHCFRLVRASDRSRIGLEFQPTPAREKRRDIAEIRGRLWLDRASSELRGLEFRYVNVNAEQEMSAGGAMEFVRMRDGTWAVSRWSVRMPQLEQVIRSQALGGNLLRRTAVKVTGGDLTLAVRGGDTLWAGPPLVLAGTVLDSTSGEPLAGARVRLGAAGPEASADAEGRFTIPGVRPGQHTLDVRTASLDSVSTVHRVPVAFLGPERRVELRVPTGAQIVAALCGARRTDAAGIVVGTVRTKGDVPLPRNVKVVAEWVDSTAADAATRQARWVEVRAEPGGSFRICSVPLDTPLALRAEADSVAATPVSVRIESGRSARADLVLDPEVSRDAVFTGAVFADSTQRPIAGAEIMVAGAAAPVLTNDAGKFRLSDVSPGQHRVLVRRLGFGPLDTTITFATNRTVDRRIYLRRVVTLDSVTVTAEPVVIRSFEEHRARGLGHFLTREQIAKQEGRRLGDVLRELPGVNVVSGTGNHGWVTSSRVAVQTRQGSAWALHWADSLAGAPAGLCYVRVYLDNAMVYRGRPREPLFDVNSIAPAQVEAIEYYSSRMQAPARYSGSESECGVLVIWTRKRR